MSRPITDRLLDEPRDPETRMEAAESIAALVEALEEIEERLAPYEDAMGYESVPGDVAASLHRIARRALATHRRDER